MKKIYQTIIDRGKGNCSAAVLASLFERDINDIPDVTGEGWFSMLWKYIKSEGFVYEGMFHNKNYTRLMNPTGECFKDVKYLSSNIITPSKLQNHSGVNGYFYAAVLSPELFNWTDQTTHAVVIDKNYNIVHDPNPNNKNILRYPLSNMMGYNGIIWVMLINKS